MVLMVFITNRPYSIQFNSKTSFKDGALLSLKPIFPGAIQTCKQMQQLFMNIYTKQYRFIRQSQQRSLMAMR